MLHFYIYIYILPCLKCKCNKTIQTSVILLIDCCLMCPEASSKSKWSEYKICLLDKLGFIWKVCISLKLNTIFTTLIDLCDRHSVLCWFFPIKTGNVLLIWTFFWIAISRKKIRVQGNLTRIISNIKKTAKAAPKARSRNFGCRKIQMVNNSYKNKQ